MTAQITRTENGPLLVDGPVQLNDFDGTRIQIRPGAVAALCRCGQSSNKPFCDGSHKASDFDGTTNPDNRRRD